MQPSFDPELIQRSLDAAERFAEAVIPLVAQAFTFSTEQIRQVPPGGLEDDVANFQALPTLFRANLIKLVKGHNRDQARPALRRRGSPNNGVWLGIAGNEEMARVYKASKKYPVRPSGRPQERLITQARYQEALLQPALIEVGDPVLDALLMWHSSGYELTAAYVVIPNGWDEAQKLVQLAEREIALPDDLDRLAAFAGAADEASLIPDTMPILSEAPETGFDEGSLLEEDFDDEEVAVEFQSQEEGLFESETDEKKRE